MFHVEFGIGVEYPGKPHSMRQLRTEDECFTPQIKELFAEAQAMASRGADDQFVWLAIKNAEGDNLFELESQLMEWLDP